MIYSLLKAIENLATLSEEYGLIINQVWFAVTTLAISTVITLVCFIFKGIGLYTIAKREGIKAPFLAFIPFASFYLLGKIVGGVKVFGRHVKNLGLITMITLIVNYALNYTYELLLYGENLVSLFTTGNVGVLPGSYGSVWVDVVLTVFRGISSIAYIICYVFLVITFFMYYAKKVQILFSLLSVFFDPIFGILVFVVRKNQRFDYSQYMKMRFDSYNANRSGGGFNNPETPFTREESPYEAYEKKKPEKTPDIDVFEDYSDKKGNNDDGKEDDLF